MAMLLLHENGTVTVCHSKTKDLAEVCRRADILIAAVGRPNFVTADMVKDGAVVIDVGINRLDNGKLCGDVKFDEVSEKASAGYILPADKQATVKVDATTIVRMHNEFRDTPKTGDDFNLGLWVSLAALSVIDAGVLGFVGYKNRKKKKED